MNPTTDDYTFEWVCDEKETDENYKSPFTCETWSGKLVSDKKLLMTFTYVPRTLGTHESMCRFVIVEKNISIPFLIVGHCLEPSVSLNLSHLKFKPILVGVWFL